MTKGFRFDEARPKLPLAGAARPKAGAPWGRGSSRAVHRLTPALVAILAGAFGLASCEGCRSASPSRSVAAAGPTPRSDAPPPTVRLFFISDLAGALEPCGCTKDQLGGLDHFGAWVQSSRALAGAAFVASAGPLFFMDPSLVPDRAEQDREKATTIARVLRRLDLAAFAPGSNDWADGPDALGSLANAAGAAVIAAESPAQAPGASVVIREVKGTAGVPLRLAFVGYGQRRPGEAPTSAQEVIRAGIEEAKRLGSNVIIALAAVGRGEAKRIADAFPELTAVVVGSAKSESDTNTTVPQGERVGDVLIVQASNHLQTVAVVDLFVREPVADGRLVRFADSAGLDRAQRRSDLTQRIDDLHVKIAAWERRDGVSPSDLAARRRDLAKLEANRDALDDAPPPKTGSFFRYTIKEIRDSLGKDPSIDAEFLAYYRSVNAHNRIAFANRQPSPPAAGEATYIGVEACSTCHPQARQFWNGTRHAHAYGSLSSQYKEFNLDCVACHVTGYERPGGSTVTHTEKLENVQCEVCHGPGSKHALNPSDKGAIVGAPQPSLCIGCHHPPHVEAFSPVERMKDILGPGHGLPVP